MFFHSPGLIDENGRNNYAAYLLADENGDSAMDAKDTSTPVNNIMVARFNL